MSKNTLAAWIAVALILGSMPGSAGNCALRDRDRQNYELFPEANRYITIEGFVGQEEKRAVEAALGRELAFSEAGKTTVCILFKDDEPLGLVHARSELGQRGTVELVWAVDLELRVRAMSVQRSRERGSAVLRSPEFIESITGKGRRQLADLLETLDRQAVETPTTANRLQRLAADCGLRTILLLEAGFADTLQRLRDASARP